MRASFMKAAPGVLLAILLAGAPAEPGSPPTAGVADILKVVQRYPTTLRSGRGVEYDALWPSPSSVHGSQPPVVRRRFLWAFKGEKAYRQFTERANPDVQPTRYKLVAQTLTETFDGRRDYNLVSARFEGLKSGTVQGALTQTRMVDVPILNMGYKVFGRWVCDVLRDGRCRLEGTERDPTLGTLYRFYLEERPSVLSRMTSRGGVERRIRFWLAPKYDYLAVRSESEGRAPGMHQLLILRTLRFERYGRIWFPIRGTRQTEDLAGSRPTAGGLSELTIAPLELNKVPDSLFEPRLAPGTLLKESETGQHWRIGPRGEWIAYQPPGRVDPGRMPIGWLFVISLTSLVMVAAGAFLRWRRPSAH